MRLRGSARLSGTVGLMAGSSAPAPFLWRNTSSRMRKTLSSVPSSQVGLSARYPASIRATSPAPSHGVKTGRNTSSRRRGTSRQRVGRLSYIVIA